MTCVLCIKSLSHPTKVAMHNAWNMRTISALSPHIVIHFFKTSKTRLNHSVIQQFAHRIFSEQYQCYLVGWLLPWLQHVLAVSVRPSESAAVRQYVSPPHHESNANTPHTNMHVWNSEHKENQRTKYDGSHSQEEITMLVWWSRAMNERMPRRETVTTPNDKRRNWDKTCIIWTDEVWRDILMPCTEHAMRSNLCQCNGQKTGLTDVPVMG